jgi:hypothetical protein
LRKLISNEEIEAIIDKEEEPSEVNLELLK